MQPGWPSYQGIYSILRHMHLVAFLSHFLCYKFIISRHDNTRINETGRVLCCEPWVGNIDVNTAKTRGCTWTSLLLCLCHLHHVHGSSDPNPKLLQLYLCNPSGNKRQMRLYPHWYIWCESCDLGELYWSITYTNGYALCS